LRCSFKSAPGGDPVSELKCTHTDIEFCLAKLTLPRDRHLNDFLPKPFFIQMAERGLNYWEIAVLAGVRLGCNLDYDKLQDLAQNHRRLRQIMGIGEVDFDWRRIEDNLIKLRPETLQKLNDLIVRAGHELEPQAIASVRHVCGGDEHPLSNGIEPDRGWLAQSGEVGSAVGTGTRVAGLVATRALAAQGQEPGARDRPGVADQESGRADARASRLSGTAAGGDRVVAPGADSWRRPCWRPRTEVCWTRGEALRQAAAGGRPFPLVVLDSHIPGTDALALATLARQTPEQSASGIAASLGSLRECFEMRKMIGTHPSTESFTFRLHNELCARLGCGQLPHRIGGRSRSTKVGVVRRGADSNGSRGNIIATVSPRAYLQPPESPPRPHWTFHGTISEEKS
jgi:hypothetical protein